MNTNINKALIAPIVALIVLYAKSVSNFEIPNETTDIITEAILAILSLLGIFTAPSKPEK